MIDNPRVFGEFKIHLTMKINFMLSQNSHKGRPMLSKSANIEILIKTKLLMTFLVQFFVDIKWV